MRRLAAVLLIVLLVAGMNVRSAWSGGAKWGSGTPSGARTDAYWLPDGQTPTGRPFPDVAIGGTLIEDLQTASWSLGISDYLADLSPNTASLTFVGQVSGVPGDEVVITSALGVQWSGRLDTVSQTRDRAGKWWTTITATDRVGALGSAQLDDVDVSGSTDMETLGESYADAAGITLDIRSLANRAFTTLTGGSASYSGSVLSLINGAARASNRMVALARNGAVYAAPRENRNKLTLEDAAYGLFTDGATLGFAGYLSGSIVRSTASPITGAGSGRITSGTTQFAGTVLALSGADFIKGRTYRVSLQARSISGNTGWYIELYSPDAGSETELITVSATAATFTVDWVPTADTSSVELYVGNMNTTSSVIDIDRVEVFEVGVLLAGASAAQEWSTVRSVDSIINKLRVLVGGVPSDVGASSETTKLYGERAFEATDFDPTDQVFGDWNFYANAGYGLRSTGSGSFVISDWSQDGLILLDPFQWVTEDGTDWQVMSVQHSVTASPYSWNVSITADTLGEDLRTALIAIFDV